MFQTTHASKRVRTSLTALLALSLIPLGGCSKTEESTVSIQFGTYTASNSIFPEFLVPSAYAALSNAKFCFKRLRFKKADVAEESEEDNVDFTPGQVTLTATGTTIGAIKLPTATYQRVEFDLEPNCVSGATNAVEGTNSNGSFSSTSNIKIVFRGTFEASEAQETLTLGVTSIITALNQLASGASGNTVRDALENAGGTF
jgi:hypothetical protein